jgi:hypothetical protein
LGARTTYEAHEYIFFSLLLLSFSRLNIPLSILFMNIPYLCGVTRVNSYSINVDDTYRKLKECTG